MAEKKIPPSPRKPSGNVILPYAVRYRICAMIQDGAAAEAIAEDPEIKGGCERIGKTLPLSAITRIKRSPEYQEIASRRTAFRQELEKEALTAIMLKESGAAEHIADSIKIALLKSISSLTDLSSLTEDEDKIKAIRSLSQSVTALSNAAKDRTIQELKSRLARTVSSKNKLKAEMEQLKLKQESEIRRITERCKKIAEPERVAAELADILGVRKK